MLINSDEVNHDKIKEFYPEYQGDFIEFDANWIEQKPGLRPFELEVYSDGTAESIHETDKFEEINFTAQGSIQGVVFGTDEADAINRALLILEENPGRKDLNTYSED